MASKFSITNTHDVEIWVCYGRHNRAIGIAAGTGLAVAGVTLAIVTAGAALVPEAIAAGAAAEGAAVAGGIGAGMMGGEMVGLAAGTGLAFAGGLGTEQISKTRGVSFDKSKTIVLKDGWDKGQPYEGHWHKLKPGETFTSKSMTLSLIWTAYAVMAHPESGEGYGASNTIRSSAWHRGNANWKSGDIFVFS